MEYAQKISKISDTNLENNLRKALGVLQEDGVYAMFLWLEEKNSKIRKEHILNLLNEPEIKKYLLNNSGGFTEKFSEFCERLKEVAKDIDKLLFIKKLLDRTLTYSLYHAKIGNENVAEN
ncbi:MAG: hypothetical protein KBH94_01180 [Caldisericia bacterium]|jgi:phage pi2 protein 07|nr:hypothetical protein [Caldisericia bacterium]